MEGREKKFPLLKRTSTLKNIKKIHTNQTGKTKQEKPNRKNKH